MIQKLEDGSLTVTNGDRQIILSAEDAAELSEFFYQERLKEDVLAELKYAEENYSQEIIETVKSDDKLIKEITEDYECNRNSCDELGLILGETVGQHLEKEELKRELYETYKQEWLDENVSPEMAEEARKEYESEKAEYGEDFEYSSFEEYIEDVGYGGGSLYVCYEEFIDCEYQDADWLSGHLTAKDAMRLAEYDRDFPLGENEIKNYEWKDSKPSKSKADFER
jgi:hypothetical protein